MEATDRTERSGLEYLRDFFLGYFTPDDGSDRFSRNVGKKTINLRRITSQKTEDTAVVVFNKGTNGGPLLHGDGS
jgi:hypothetical protein